MAKKIEIIGNSLTIFDTVLSKRVTDIPRHLVYYKLNKLVEEGIISIFVVGNLVNQINVPSSILLADAIDADDLPFTEEGFINFANVNLGSDSTGTDSGNPQPVELAKNVLGYDAWGKPKVTIDNSLFHGMFTYNVPVTVWSEEINGLDNLTGTFVNSTSVNGKLNLTSGAGLNDTTYLRTLRNPRYEPNRGHIFSTSVFLPNPTALGIRRWGYFTAESGAFFELNPAGLYGVVRTTVDGVTTDNANIIDTTGLDLSKGNLYDIQMQWRGVGDYNFIINTKKALVVELLSTATELSMYNPANPIAFECENVTDEVVIQAGCVDITAEGGEDNGKTYGSMGISNINGQVPISGYNVPIIAAKSLKTVNGLINTRDTLALLVNAYSDQRSLVRVWVTRDLTAITENDQVWKDFGDGHLQYIEYDNPDVGTPMTFDTSKASIVFGSRIDQDQTYTTTALFEDRTSIYMHPSDMFIFTIHRETGTACNVGLTFEFAEEI